MELSRLEESIGYTFKNKDLLTEALSHSSYVNELRIKKNGCYERLEFLGDSILEFVSSSFLFKKYPLAREGELSTHRAALVCEKALAACARKINLSDYILVGRGEKLSKGNEKESIMADVMEAIIGAIYIDSGAKEAFEFADRFIVSDDDTGNYTDYKTKLQELVQATPGTTVRYEVLKESGPEHDRVFCVNVYVNDISLGKGEGKNKKEAEQRAAREAIKVYAGL